MRTFVADFTADQFAEDRPGTPVAIPDPRGRDPQGIGDLGDRISLDPAEDHDAMARLGQAVA